MQRRAASTASASPIRTRGKQSDEKNLTSTIKVTSIALWIPHLLALLWIAVQNDTTLLVGIAVLGAICVGATYFTAVHLERGDFLMVLAWAIGLFSETRGFSGPYSHLADIPRWTWIVVAIAHGIVGGVLSKAKDLEEGRYFEGHSIAERLYVVVPFTIGQWFGYVLANGWSGVVVVLSTIFLCLSTVGYGVFTYKILSYFGITADVIGFVSKLFTTSFGVVFGSVLLFVSFVVYLAVPFLSSLLSLNALVSSAGIVFEILLYQVA